MRPRIALTVSRLDVPDPRTRELRSRARARYVAALERAGADVVVIEPSGAALEVDGLCLAGGEDVDPSRYGAEKTSSEAVDPERDRLELELARRALARDVPVLGICRGFQVLNVAYGGSLVQHREGHRPHPLDVEGVVTHVVAPLPGTLLAAACGERPLRVNSRHHQVVTDRELAPGLRVSARVDDVVEALESPAQRFVLGVQWHPERTAEVDPEALGVFSSFVRAAEPVGDEASDDRRGPGPDAGAPAPGREERVHQS